MIILYMFEIVDFIKNSKIEDIEKKLLDNLNSETQLQKQVLSYKDFKNKISMKILIIEDKEKNLLSAQKFASECGHEVVIINNYDDAAKALNRKRENGELKPLDYDMVMTDLFLPPQQR